MVTVITVYRGYQITYYEPAEEFQVNLDGQDLEDGSLKVLKGKIDKIISPSKKFKRVPIYLDTWDVWKRAFITSIPDEGMYEQAWTIDNEKHRRKVGFNQCYLDTPENSKKINATEALRLARKKIDDKIRATKKSLERFTMDKP